MSSKLCCLLFSQHAIFFFSFGCLYLKSQLANSILMLRIYGQSLHQGHGRRIEGWLPHESIAKLCKSCFVNLSNVSFGEVTNRRKQNLAPLCSLYLINQISIQQGASSNTSSNLERIYSAPKLKITIGFELQRMWWWYIISS